MEEETKREPESSKEKIEETFEPPKEAPTEVKERTEALLKDLLEEETEEEKRESPKEKKTISFLLILSGLIILLLLVSAFFVLYKLFQKKEISKPLSQVPSKVAEQLPLEEKPKVIPKVLNVTESEQVAQKSYTYRLDLKNFLIPLDEQTFLKMDVYLYFERPEDYKKAQKINLSLRHFIFEEVKKEKPLVWREEKGLKRFEEDLKVKMEKEPLKLNPAKIELDGTILRV